MDWAEAVGFVDAVHDGGAIIGRDEEWHGNNPAFAVYCSVDESVLAYSGDFVAYFPIDNGSVAADEKIWCLWRMKFYGFEKGVTKNKGTAD